MRQYLLILLLIGLFVSPLRAQQDTIKLESIKQKSMLEKVGYVCGASLAFSLFDYIGFGLVRETPGPHTGYRVLQVAVQSAITYFLYKQCGLPSAISFNLIWWTWGDDLAYNGWGNVFNMHYPPWENRSVNGLSENQITWASWTPIGLLRPKGQRIPKDALFGQAIIGFSLSIAILQFWFFKF